MINIRTIKKIAENGGLTLKNGKVITYKSGWQVADHGIEAKRTAEELPRTSQRFARHTVGNLITAAVCGKLELKPPTKGGFCRALHKRSGREFSL